MSAALVAGLSGCGAGGDAGAPSYDSATSPASDDALPDVEIITEDAAAAEAAATITEENADAVFEELSAELESELGEGGG